jgi:acetylornithine deacetylase/succinyl-diaminopimelate desuccinylase-like protein
MGNNKFEVLQLPEREALIRSLTDVESWINDPENAITIITDIIALLISKDTRGSKPYLEAGVDLQCFPEVIKELLNPLIECGFLEVEILERANPIVIIHPCSKEIVTKIKELPTEVDFDNLAPPIYIPQVLLFAHFDTYGFAEPMGKNVALKSNDLIYGRGANDMKGQIAMLIMTLYALNRIGSRDFFVILSSNEEYNAISDEFLFYNIKANLAFDLEPTSTVSGALVTQFAKTLYVDFSTSTKLSAKELAKYDPGFKRLIEIVTELLIRIKITNTSFFISFTNKHEVSITFSKVLEAEEIQCIVEGLSYYFSELCNGGSLFVEGSLTLGADIEISPNANQIIRRAKLESGLEQVAYSRTPMHNTGLLNNEIGFQTIYGNFATQLQLTSRPVLKDLIVGSVAEVGARHSGREAVNPRDLISFMKFLIEVIYNHEKLAKSEM